MQDLFVTARSFTRIGRTVLIVGYPSGLQIWDCSNLGSISEILNLSGASWSDIKTAVVLPNPDNHGIQDTVDGVRPLIGIMWGQIICDVLAYLPVSQ